MPELHATPFVPGSARGIFRRGCSVIQPDHIVLLTQQELEMLDSHPAGILVVDAAPLSHTLIRLLNLGIPTVLVNGDTAASLVENREVFIDGYNGTIEQPPASDRTMTADPETPAAGEPVILNDGSRLELRASIFSVEDAAQAVRQGAASIGLVRTEFLMPEDGSQPDAVFYEKVLRALCSKAWPLSVTIRLPDISPDKQVPWLKSAAGVSGPLGLQGVRLYDEEPLSSVVNALLYAVNRIASDYDLKLLLPYVTSLEEFSAWRAHVEHQLDRTLPIGTMAEAPAAVLAIPHWFEVADFVAIGCNDLMQCMFSADRDLADVRKLLDPYSPELLRFLRQAADAAGEDIDKVQLCGLLAQTHGLLPVLLGMGYRIFSVAPVMIPYLARAAREADLPTLIKRIPEVCAATDSAQVRSLLL